MRYVNSILIFAISLILMASCHKKKEESVSPLYGVWDTSFYLSEGDLTLTMHIEMSFQNDSTGAFEFSGVPVGGEVAYNRMNFTYVLNGENLDLQMQGSNNSVNLKITELTKESFVLNGFINLFPIDTSELSEKDIRKLEIFNNLKFVKSSVSPEDRKMKKIEGDADEIWKIRLGQKKEDAYIVLMRDNYKVSEDNGKLSVNQEVIYMDIPWDSFSIMISPDGFVEGVEFTKKGKSLNESEIDNLVKKLDDKYGNHRIDKSSAQGLRMWDWKNGPYEIGFASVDVLNVQSLSFKKDKLIFK